MSPLVCPAVIYSELYVSRNHDENFSRSIPSSHNCSPDWLVATGLEDENITCRENKFSNRDKALSGGINAIRGTRPCRNLSCEKRWNRHENIMILRLIASKVEIAHFAKKPN